MTTPTDPTQPPLDAPESNPTGNPGPDTPGPSQPLADPPQEPLPEPPSEPLPEPDPEPLPRSAAEDMQDAQGAEVLGSSTPQEGPGQLERDPQDWVTGDDPATEAQKSYLDRLASSAGEQIPAEGLTKAQASEHIDRLQDRTGMEPRQS